MPAWTIVPIILAITLAFYGGPSHASEARHCIKIESIENKSSGRTEMALKNKCPDKVYIRWCYEGTGKGACGGDKFYNKNRALDANDFHTSKYGLPMGSKIHFAACFGKLPHVFKTAEKPRNYTCDPVIRCQDDAKAYVFKHAKEMDTKTTSVFISKSGGQTHTIRINKSELSEYTHEPDKLMKLFARLRVCGQKDKPDFGEETLEEAQNYMRQKLRYYGDKCANDAAKPWYCPLIFEKTPKPSGSSGVQG